MADMEKLRNLIERYDEGEITVIEYTYQFVGDGLNRGDSERIEIWYEKK